MGHCLYLYGVHSYLPLLDDEAKMFDLVSVEFAFFRS
jgi:hypothetical protein